MEVAEIDRLNIYWAAMLARQRAVEALALTSAHVMVDGKRRIAGVKLPKRRWSRVTGCCPRLRLHQ